MPKRWSVKEIRDFVGKEGYKLISNSYKTQKDKLKMVCNNGHECDISFDNFKNGKRCKTCNENNKSQLYRQDTLIIKNKYEEIGYKVVSGLENYKNQKSKLTIECDKGHAYPSTYQSLQVGSKCPICFGKNKLDIEFVRNEFIKKGFTLLSKSYINSNTHLEYICNQHDFEVQKVTWNNFKQNRCCKYCGQERTASARRLDYEIVEKEFIKRGFSLLTKEYVNYSQKLRYICNSHPSVIQEVSYNDLMAQKYTCSYCFSENKKGENSYLWKGGKTSTIDYLRKNINDWKLESMKNCDYKCVITGEPFDVIHHVYSFNKIVDEVMNELNIDYKKNIGDYTDDELNKIKNKCLELHFKYPLGVCLTESIHREYHSTYGFDNTPEQFEEFMKIKL